MSNIAIRRALETALNDLTPSFETAWENSNFEPTKNIPYQLVNLLFTAPINPAIGGNGSAVLTRQQGFLQVALMYPLQFGTLTVETRAELIKDVFKRATSLVNAGITVIINKTPEVMPGVRDNDRWRVVIKVPFYANIFI